MHETSRSSLVVTLCWSPEKKPSHNHLSTKKKQCDKHEVSSRVAEQSKVIPALSSPGNKPYTKNPLKRICENYRSNNLPKYSPSGPQPDILLRFVFSIFLLDDTCKNSENK